MIEVYPNFYMKGVNIGQLMMETHFRGSREPHEEMMENLQKNGFAIFSKEPNTGYSGTHQAFYEIQEHYCVYETVGQLNGHFYD